jgi:hypothetical protein
MVSRMDKIFGVPVIYLGFKTDVERFRLSKEPKDKIVLFERVFLPVDKVYIERVELRHYQERLDVNKGFYSLLTVYLKSNKGELELKFDEGFKGNDPLHELSLILMKHVGLESLINRLMIALNEQGNE